MLICVGKETCEIEVFVEHDILAHSEPPLYLGTPNSRHEDVQEGEDEDFSSEEEVDRPLEDEEPDQSEDEMNESVAEEKNEHIQPKLPPKPRGRKKTPATTGCCSQPIQSTATAEADVSCSAPQPFVSTNRLKAHVKKAPRGPPLKIRKTGNIPHGVGKFWSPFTDRPFEVFGD
ncbi:hypothetical protein F2Q69_00016342 [Brassica cretica]|uniref:Uncharacterized protein n=1 Tax=Brassica cretica TaxID=69181 RepID=A0A8S9QTF8_BRACR|nr:hypothetical protein F2Q69_00016342 [Brassica cretica]